MKKLTAADRDAFQRAIDLARAESEGSRKRIDEKLAEDGFAAAGQTASYWAQDARLGLRPWQCPPCWLLTDADVKAALAEPPPDLQGLRMAGELVRQLLAHGLSRFEPDPLGAIARSQAKAKTVRNAAERVPAT